MKYTNLHRVTHVLLEPHVCQLGTNSDCQIMSIRKSHTPNIQRGQQAPGSRRLICTVGDFYSKCFVLSGILELTSEAHQTCIVRVCIPALFYTASRMGQTCPTIPTWPICKYLTRRSSLIDHLSATKNNRKQKAKIITKNVHCICPITHASSKV